MTVIQREAKKTKISPFDSAALVLTVYRRGGALDMSVPRDPLSHNVSMPQTDINQPYYSLATVMHLRLKEPWIFHIAKFPELGLDAIVSMLHLLA